MKFSEYVILGRQGMMMDPLGFQSPYTTLQDKLFKQFTVLSNHPAYHGVLALIYSVLAEAGVTPKHKEFSLQFRRAEILWGMFHAVDSASSSVLNITKYAALIGDRESMALGVIKQSDRIYSRLGYGTLGHYSSPSTTWGILNKSGQNLTERGGDLAAAFSEREGKSLRKALASWLVGDSWDLSRLEQFASLFEIAATPDRAEAAVWRQVIDEYCERNSQTRCLWEKPLTAEEEKAWQNDAMTYAAGFDRWRSQYAPLKAELTQIELFQQLSGLVQHIFEREYLACAQKGNQPLPFSELEKDLAVALRETASAYTQTPDFSDSKGLFAALTDVRDYQEAAQGICLHHIAHQKAKGSVPFMEGGEIRVRDKFDMDSYGKRRSALESAASRSARIALIAFQHPRDWHFKRAGDYHRYAHQA
jgi:hypothetical protein